MVLQESQKQSNNTKSVKLRLIGDDDAVNELVDYLDTILDVNFKSPNLPSIGSDDLIRKYIDIKVILDKPNGS